MAVWDFRGTNWPTDLLSAIKGWLSIEKCIFQKNLL